MPISVSRNGRSAADPPSCLRPYAFHGVDLSVRGGQGVGDCPFCGKEGKFSVDAATGLWRCFVCGGGTDSGGGNALVFLRVLHAAAVAATMPHGLSRIAQERRLCDSAIVAAWGGCVDSGGSWLIPGYGTDGKLDQLYRRTHIKNSKGEWEWRLLPTPGVWTEGKGHALHMAAKRFDVANPEVMVCEGPWDGMALDEVMYSRSTSNVIAVPGCGTWRDEWTALCKGKQVTLLYDSDHPLPEPLKQGKVVRPGYDGMQRVAKKLSGVAASVRCVRWGEEWYAPFLPSGWDVRDELSGGDGPPLLMVDRITKLGELMAKVEDAPAEWFVPTPSANGKHVVSVEAQQCSDWITCEYAWKGAMQWRQDMSDALAVLLAVCASTQQGGNQLFLQLVGSAGSGKTTMCDGLLVSGHCHHLEHLTGFHSGWKHPEDGKKDCSLIARINGKTLVTPEADVLMSSPRFTEIMGQQRRIFDGKSGATYKNSDEDTLYVGLRTPWIMAGTPAMLDHDQSHLGDRFLRFIIADPMEDEKRAILRSALRSERVAMLNSANGTAGSLVDPKTRMAHALTGGYVDWLRAHVEEELALVDVPPEAEDKCIDLAELSADLRARPNADKRKQESHDTKELPTRLARQNIRMASCLAVVLNKRVVDGDVLRVVRKVALDTAHGHSLNIVQWMCAINHKVGKTYQACGGLQLGILETWSGMPQERLLNYLAFLRKIGVLEYQQMKQTSGMWRLTDRVYDLYLRCMGD